MKLQLIVVLLVVSLMNCQAQEASEKYPLNDFFEDYFSARKLNTVLKHTDPEGSSIVYVVDGIKLLEKINPKLFFIHESYPTHHKVTIQTRFTIEELWSIKERYDLINTWANPSHTASIFWDNSRQVFVLSVTTVIFAQTTTLERIDDLYLGFVAALKNLNDTQKIKI